MMRCLLIAVSITSMTGSFPALAQQPPAENEKQQTVDKPDDFAQKLIRTTVDDSASQDPMAEMTALMEEIAQRLQVDFDPGEQTQSLQRDVSARLNEAIKAAAARRRAKAQPDPKQMADKRTSPAPKKPEQSAKPKGDPAQAQSKESAEQSPPQAEGKTSDDKSLPPALRRGWGNLPQRDRDEVLQGADEEFLERFRPWIEQYYRALQESNR